MGSKNKIYNIKNDFGLAIDIPPRQPSYLEYAEFGVDTGI